MTDWYRFAGYNEGAVYGYGTEAEARAYADLLDADRADTGAVTVRIVTDADEIARLENGNEGIVLADGIGHLSDAAPEDDATRTALTRHISNPGRLWIVRHDADGIGRTHGTVQNEWGDELSALAVGRSQGEDMWRGAYDWRVLYLRDEPVGELHEDGNGTTVHIGRVGPDGDDADI